MPLSEKLIAAALQVLRPHDRQTVSQQVTACRSISAGLISDSSGQCTVSTAGFSCNEPVRRINALFRQAAARLDIKFRWSTLQINHSASCDWHTDPQGQAAIIIGLGEYEDGLFQAKGEAPCNVASRALLFDPRVSHRALPAKGDKTTVVAYLHPDSENLHTDDKALLVDLGFRFLDDAPSDTSDDDEDGHRRIKLGAALQGKPPPLNTRWAGKRRPYHDGAGLTSPYRWPSEDRRTPIADMYPDLIIKLRGIVAQITDPSREVFKMATGNAEGSPFSGTQLKEAREAIADALGLDRGLAFKIRVHQPFLLELLSATLEKIGDPDWRQLTKGKWSFDQGVPIGVGIRMPRTPAVYERKTSWRALDDTPLDIDKDNYQSAKGVLDQLEEQFRVDEAEGMMFQESEESLRRRYPAGMLRIAALGAIENGPHSFRVVHDGTHGVRLNNEVKPRDQVRMPGPGEVRALLGRASVTPGVHFSLSADISKAHRRFVNRESDWGLQACRIRPPNLWVNRVGTFGVGSACYWWSRLAGLVARFVGAFTTGENIWQLLFADDLHWVAHGPAKYPDLLFLILLWEVAGTPFAWHKTKGGVQTDWIGYWLDYGKFELGITEARGRWLATWLADTVERGASLVRTLREALGRLGFAAGVLEWHKPFLAPLYSWTAAAPQGAYLSHPPAVQLALIHLRDRFAAGARTSSCRAFHAHEPAAYFADARADDDKVVLGGWEAISGRPTGQCRWYSFEIKPQDAPWFFPGGRPSRTIAALELLATVACVALFGPPLVDGQRAPLGPRKGTLRLTSAFTDNKGNAYAAARFHSTKFPLSCIVMELATQLEARGLWMDLHWTPRELNTLADQLTNEDFTGFDPKLRVETSFSTLPFVALPSLLESGAALQAEVGSLNAGRTRAPPPPAKRRLKADALRNKEPW